MRTRENLTFGLSVFECKKPKIQRFPLLIFIGVLTRVQSFDITTNLDDK